MIIRVTLRLADATLRLSVDSDHYFVMSCAGEEADATPGHGSAHHRVRDPVTGVTRRWFDSIRSQRMGVSAQLTRERCRACTIDSMGLVLLPLTTRVRSYSGQRHGLGRVKSEAT